MTLFDKVPYETWASKKPSPGHLRVFGCNLFLQVPKYKRSKLNRRFEKCIFVGYKDGVKGYKLWNLIIRKMVYSRGMIFREVEGTSRFEEVIRERN